MTNAATQVTLEHDSGLPEDRAVNTYSFDISAVDPVADLTAIHTALFTLYSGLDQYLSSTLSGVMTVKSYDRSDPIPRVPIYETSHVLTVGTTAMAPEVALCVSFQGAKVAGEPQARRRGRVFIGPLYGTAVDTATGRPAAGMRTAVAGHFNTFLDTAQASTWGWDVWSTVNLDGTEVANGWVDDTFDTQRRRGLRPTLRTTFS